MLVCDTSKYIHVIMHGSLLFEIAQTIEKVLFGSCLRNIESTMRFVDVDLLQPCNYQLRKSIVSEIKFGDKAVM